MNGVRARSGPEAIQPPARTEGREGALISIDAHTERTLRRRAFTLFELMLVVLIIAFLAAIAIPRMSRGATGATEAVLVQDLDILRKAIDHYASEHQGAYPSANNFKKQLTKYTDESGNISNQLVPPFIYGPYLAAIPNLPVGNGGGQVGATTDSGVGWIYDPVTGAITANTTTEADGRGVLYNTY